MTPRKQTIFTKHEEAINKYIPRAVEYANAKAEKDGNESNERTKWFCFAMNVLTSFAGLRKVAISEEMKSRAMLGGADRSDARLSREISGA